MRGGYILVHRRMMDSFIFQNPHYLKLWMYCLMKAVYKEETVTMGKQTVQLAPGELIWGRTLATEVLNRGLKKADQKTGGGWDHLLQVLEGKEMIQRRSYRRFTVIKVVNYEVYQKGRAADAAPEPEEVGDNPYTMYQKAYNQPMTAVVECSITEWTKRFDGQGAIVAYAIQLAGLNGAATPRYFEAILRTWQQKNIKTLTEAESYTQEFEAAKEREIAEKLERQSLEKRLARSPKDELPELSLYNFVTKEK